MTCCSPDRFVGDIEEMAGNVVQHAFSPGDKRWLDLAIVDQPETVIVSIRDNGSPFNPVAHLISEPSEEYGILLIRNLAKNIEYRRNIGLNNLIIHLQKNAR